MTPKLLLTLLLSGLVVCCNADVSASVKAADQQEPVTALENLINSDLLMDLGKRLYNFGRKELQHRIGGDDIDRRDVGPADILISFVIARLALQIPSVLINLSLIPFLPVANVGFRLAAQAVLLAVKIAFDIVAVVYVAKIWGAKKKKEKEEDAEAYEAALAADQATGYLVPPPQTFYETRSSANSINQYTNNNQASNLWMHNGRKLGNTPVVAVQGKAVRNAA